MVFRRLTFYDTCRGCVLSGTSALPHDYGGTRRITTGPRDQGASHDGATLWHGTYPGRSRTPSGRAAQICPQPAMCGVLCWGRAFNWKAGPVERP
jgi:hypothetical protein